MNQIYIWKHAKLFSTHSLHLIQDLLLEAHAKINVKTQKYVVA